MPNIMDICCSLFDSYGCVNLVLIIMVKVMQVMAVLFFWQGLAPLCAILQMFTIICDVPMVMLVIMIKVIIMIIVLMELIIMGVWVGVCLFSPSLFWSALIAALACSSASWE